MKNFLLYSLIIIGSLNFLTNISYGDQSTADIIDQETAQYLVDGNRLIRLRRRSDAREVLFLALERLDTSVPLLDSVYKRLKRVRFNLRKRKWFRAQSIMKKILIDLNLWEELENLYLSTAEGDDCEEKYEDFLYKCELSFGSCAPFNSNIEVCFILLDKCRSAAKNQKEKCLADTSI